jgi:hypothetical protein
MLMFLIHTRAAWDDYFTGNPNLIQSKVYRERQTPSVSSAYVLNCLFKSITSTDNGGALFSTSVTYFLFESTSFLSCSTSSSNGGAISIISSGGQCVLNEVCGYDCCITNTSLSGSHFAYIRVNKAATSKNYANYSSITRCVNEMPNSYITFRLDYGKICCPSVNISMNKCHYYSGFYSLPLMDSNSITCSLTYTSFTDNNSTNHTCIHFWTAATNCEMKSCNILRNTQSSLYIGGTFYLIVNLMIEDSCILENKANCIFLQSDFSCTITLSNCTVDSTSHNRNLVIQNTITKSFIHALNHMFTRNCHSEYDSVGTLTPIIQHSSSKNQKHLCTCGNGFYQFQIRNLISLISIFHFNFIYLDTSIDHWY